MVEPRFCIFQAWTKEEKTEILDLNPLSRLAGQAGVVTFHQRAIQQPENWPDKWLLNLIYKEAGEADNTSGEKYRGIEAEKFFLRLKEDHPDWADLQVWQTPTNQLLLLDHWLQNRIRRAFLRCLCVSEAIPKRWGRRVLNLRPSENHAISVAKKKKIPPTITLLGATITAWQRGPAGRLRRIQRDPETKTKTKTKTPTQTEPKEIS